MNKNIRTKIIIYEPEILFWGVAAGFHGYAIAFINQYADFIYVKKGLKNSLLYRRQLWRMEIKRYIPFIHSLDYSDEVESILVGFTIPNTDDEELFRFRGKKYFHLMDYYLFISRNKEFLKKYSINYVIGHTDMENNCELFREYYQEFIGRTIALPFGHHKRFICFKPFKDRKNIAIGLGSINPVDDPKLSYDAKKEFMEYFKDEDYMHPLRRYIQTHEKDFENEIVSKFPSPEKQKDFSYDAVDVLNSYTMFINDAGLSNFPPARTFEGIACGCVMVAENNRIYKDLGFIPNVNYIAFEPGNYNDMKCKIDYYIEHPDELLEMQKKSLKLSTRYSHKNVADTLYNKIAGEYTR